jgi:hypothetical protein
VADRTIVASRRADAMAVFDTEARKLSELLGIAPPVDIPQEISRDPNLRQVHELERVNKILADANGVLTEMVAAADQHEQAQRDREAEELQRLADERSQLETGTGQQEQPPAGNEPPADTTLTGQGNDLVTADGEGSDTGDGADAGDDLDEDPELDEDAPIDATKPAETPVARKARKGRVKLPTDGTEIADAPVTGAE